jgi:hypothetical protein
MAQSDNSAAAETPVEQKIEDHLSRALETESSEKKNYHIRSALQLYVVSKAGAER